MPPPNPNEPINAAQQAVFNAMAHSFMRALFQQFPWLAQATIAPHTVNRGHGPEMVSNPQLMAEIADNLNDLNNNLETMIDVEVSLGEASLPRKDAANLMRMVERRRRANRRRGREE